MTMDFPRIACLPDLLRAERAAPEGTFDLVREPIRQGCGIDIGFAPGGRRPHGLHPAFDPARFRALAGVDMASPLQPQQWAAGYHRLPDGAIDYLFEHLPARTLLLSFEIPPWLARACTERGVDFLDLRPSPLRFGRDLYIALRSSSAALRQRIAPHGVPGDELRLEAALLGANVRMHKVRLESDRRYRFDSLDGALLFVGQAPYDASLLAPGGRSLHCGDYADALRALCQGRRLLHKPHPFAPAFAQEEREALQRITGHAPEPCQQNAYQILGSEDDVALVGISSGLLQEAAWFGKTAQLLYQPFVPLARAGAADAHTYQQIHFRTLLAPVFWHQVLAPGRPPPRLAALPELAHHHARETINQWWDYSKVMTWERALPYETVMRGGGAALRQRIEALERALAPFLAAPRIDAPADAPARGTIGATEPRGIPQGVQIAAAATPVLRARFDILVKYLYALARLDRLPAWANVDPVALYRRHIHLRTGGVEPGEEQRKASTADYVRHFDALIDAMARDGFDQAHPVPLSLDDGLPRGGAHRLAAALAVGCNAAVTGERGPGWSWDDEWFRAHGFPLEERNALLRAWAQLTGARAAVAVLWSPVETAWSELEAAIGAEMPVVSHRTVELPRAGFEELVHDIYAFDWGARTGGNIARKIALLSPHAPRLRVLFVEQPADAPPGLARQLKARLRERLAALSPVDHFTTLHISESAAEMQHLLAIFASANNLRWLARRGPLRPQLLEGLDALRAQAARRGFAADACCVVGGSVLDALGLRAADDLDFTLHAVERAMHFDDGVTAVAPRLDVVTRGYARSADGTPAIDDDRLIDDPGCHFLVRGVRFADPRIVLARKQQQRRDKDLRDVALLGQWFEEIGMGWSAPPA